MRKKGQAEGGCMSFGSGCSPGVLLNPNSTGCAMATLKHPKIVFNFRGSWLLNHIEYYQSNKEFHKEKHCKYYPSCSEYAEIAIKKHGSVKGFFYMIYRLLRCNPWSRGGVDEVK
ncbi:MAG TPA: membrane protein insertion efficiency factor YidD [archaeon]|nr:membrane protein insertion efficiency factor YidD [archaeon]